MHIFLSWSKPRSHKFAQAVHAWLPEVIQEVDPWLSSEDIAKGKRWSAEIAERLDEISEGIVCITAENVGEPWLNFEAGALAKSRADATVRPLLLDIAKSEVVGPLAEFQATTATDRDDMWLLVRSINDRCARPLDEDRLRRSFDRTWPDFAAALDALKATPAVPDGKKPTREADDMFAEILNRIRQIERAVTSGTTGMADASRRYRGARMREAREYAAPVQPGWRVRHPSRGIGEVIETGTTSGGTPWARARYYGGESTDALMPPWLEIVAPTDAVVDE
jgi:hypothetical protein